jgi:hypothetical protein
MQSSRDSSIWRSLAVAFGDGVAFGVGVKLAQGPQRPAAGAQPAVGLPFAERLEQIEQRLSSIEQAPAPAVSMAPSAPAPFDQKVLEAVVNALDARLREQAGQTERRLTELEAKFAIEFKTLDQQDRSIVTGLQGRLDEVHGQYNEHITGIRDAVAQDMDVLYGQIAQLRQELTANTGEGLEARIAAAVASQVEIRTAGMEARLHGQVTDAVDRAALQIASAAGARLDEQLGPVHTALNEKDREVAELRQRLADSDQTVLDLILAIGDMCRQVAGRISSPQFMEVEPDTGAPPEPPASLGSDPQPSDPPSGSPPDPPLAIALASMNIEPNGHARIEPIPIAAAENAVPTFAQTPGPSRLWRVPLVSSFLILAAGSLWLLK